MGAGHMVGDEMSRVQAIWEHPGFRARLAAIERAERERPFCRHGLDHLLDVARIAWMLALEGGEPVSRDEAYAAALLHDIGRAEQYADGTPHDVAGARIAADILDTLPQDLRFSAEERAAILAAVRGHRASHAMREDAASGLAGKRAGAGGAMEGPEAQRADVPDAEGPCAEGRHVEGPDAKGSHELGERASDDRAKALASLISRADNLSRACYACPAQGSCYWSEERKNLSICV